MDPAVVAALVSTPSTVIAAGAAWAVGRAQARSAERGPVDAVRRQHQRDAYAEFIRAAWSYVASTRNALHLVNQMHGARLPFDGPASDAVFRLSRAIRESSRPLGSADLAAIFAPAEVPQVIDGTFVVLELLSSTWLQDIRDSADQQLNKDLVVAEVVVTLEGPDRLAELAEQLKSHANAVHRRWKQTAAAPFMRFGRTDDPQQDITPNELHERLEEAVHEFTRAARVHLNAY